MLTVDRAQALFDKLRKFSTADEIELLIFGGRSSLTRFANNTIHQNVAEVNAVISVRTVFAGRTARATTNKFDDESLRRVVESAEALSKVQHPDPDLLPMSSASEAQPATTPQRNFAETAALEPAERAATVRQVVDIAKREKLTAAGICSSSESFEAIFNSRGLARHHAQTSSEISVTMLAADSSGWQKANSPDVRQLDARRLAGIAAEKARQSAAPEELPPGKFTVVLEPAAVLDLSVSCSMTLAAWPFWTSALFSTTA